MRNNTGDKLRVLLVVEACNPTWASVPLVGYNFAKALAARPDVEATIVTHVRNRTALKNDPLGASAELQFIDNEFIAGPLHRLGKIFRGGETLSWTTNMAMAWPAYIYFERQVFKQFRGELERAEFDLIHRITPVSPTMGSPLASLADVPMILGPLNGGLPWPKEYPELRLREREWLVPLRMIYKRLPYYRSTYRHAAAVIAGSRHTASEIPAAFTGKRFYMPENGVDPDRFPVADDWPEPFGLFRFITVGRLVPYKGTAFILEAMRDSAALRTCELHIVGDGPDRERLESLTREFGLSGNVRFLGWLDQQSLAAELGHSQAFVFPSLREFGGGVVLEAFSRGLPAIVVDYGGPGELVTPQCGIALPMAPAAELTTSLQGAMEQLAGDPARCRRMGRYACRMVREQFTWNAKAARIVKFYNEVLGRQTCSTTEPLDTLALTS